MRWTSQHANVTTEAAGEGGNDFGPITWTKTATTIKAQFVTINGPTKYRIEVLDPATEMVQYGSAAVDPSGSPGSPMEITLSGLTPATQHHVQVAGSNQQSSGDLF
jgi:hypothetical protein